MTPFDWLAAIIVVTSFIYLSFVLTLKEWFEGLRKGQAVTLLPARSGRDMPIWANLALVLVGLGLAGLMLYYLWIPFIQVSTTASVVLGVAGLVVYLVGLWFVLWARRTLGRNWGLSTSRQVKLLDDHVLIQDGPFAWVRHPMYFGWLMCMLGLTLLYPVWMILVLLISCLVAFPARAHREESALAERFGEQWNTYAARTRFMIPFVY